MKPLDTHSPFIFGEVLFDLHPSGSVLGGSPLNVAWHLQGLGLTPCLVSRVGKDSLGTELIAKLNHWGINTVWIQEDDIYPTGCVQITTLDGEPQYDIKSEQAYDFIAAEPALASLYECQPALCYHGSLSLRHCVSRTTYELLCRDSSLPIFLDVNLRQPWADQDILETILHRADWVKCNEAELMAIMGVGECIESLARECLSRYDLKAFVVTLGERGALVVDASGQVNTAVSGSVCLSNTVGAGDAFSAVCIYGLLQEWSWPMILPRAVALASRLCEEAGAICEDPTMYAQMLTSWSE